MKSKKANRGMFLESIIDKTNEFYMLEGIADIRKVPTPFQVIRPYEKNPSMKVGFLKKGNWVDYVGISYNKMICFEAKETKGKSLSLSRIPEHQYEFLKSYHNKGAQAFLIVYFSDMDKFYKIYFKTLETAFKEAKEGERKSIPIKVFEKEAIELRINLSGHLFYL